MTVPPTLLPDGPMPPRREPFGQLPDGRLVELVTLANGTGMSVTLMSYGAAIQALTVPDAQGRGADVVLGHATLRAYLDQPQYMGAVVGRLANRLAGGRFRLDGRDYRVPANNGPNALHGGPEGFDRKLWEIADLKPGQVSFRLVSPDGDQGFPGTVTVTATYALSAANVLTLDMTATSDRPTILALSNHAYWNLAGEGAPDGAMGHVLTIPAAHYLPTDATAIPTGELRPVAGTVFDFRAPTAIGARVRDASDAQIGLGRGYDHHWVVDTGVAAAPRLLARLEEPRSGRSLEIWSNQPGLQFYSGNFLDGTTRGKAGHLYRQGDAVALEPQMCPDTPNHPAFGSVRLDPGQTYHSIIASRLDAR